MKQNSNKFVLVRFLVITQDFRRNKHMLRAMRILTIITVVLLFSMSGCRKESKSPEASEETVKTAAEYDAEAKKEINEQNMDQELDKLDQELAQEAAQTQ